MKKKRTCWTSLVFLLVTTTFASEQRSMMSAPLDLLSESLASSSSLINQLMMRQSQDEKGYGGPMASALLAKASRKVSERRFQPFRRRRQTTTTTAAPTELLQEPSTRETLVFACPEPEGCPSPVLGQKYEPTKIDGKGNLERPRDVLDTIYRQQVVKNKKVMRVRKKQRKPTKDSETTTLPIKAVEMVSEMVKEAGPVLTQQEIEIIADVSQEVGAKVNEKQVKVIAKLSEAMGPRLSVPELEAIAEVTTTIKEDATLASDSTLEVVAEMVKAKVGETMTEDELQQINEIMTTDLAPVPNVDNDLKKSGLDDHAAEMVAQMLNNIGSNPSVAEVAIVSNMIKELDKDVPIATAEVMAQVLVEMMPKVTPDLVHNVSAALSSSPPNLNSQDVQMVAQILEVAPLSQPLPPQVIQMVAEMAVDERMEEEEVVREVEQHTDVKLEESDVAAVKHVVEAVMSQNKVLEEPDLEVISLMSEASSDSAPSGLQQQDNSKDEKLSPKETLFLSDVRKLFGDNVTPTERAELEVEIKKADPTLNENQAEVMTQLLIEMGPEIPPEEIKEVSELVADPSLDIRSDNVKKIADMVNEVDAPLEPHQVMTVAELVRNSGATISPREMHMMMRMTGLERDDAIQVAEVVKELGPQVSHSEAEIISMMTKKISESAEANQVGDMVKKALMSMGKAVTNPEKKVIAEMIEKVEKKIEEVEAEIVAEVVQEVGPQIPEKTVEKLTEAVMEADAIDTPEEAEKVLEVLEENSIEEVKADTVVMITKLMDRMAMKGQMQHAEMVQVANIATQLGTPVTMQEVKAVAELQEAVGDQLTEDDAKLIEVMAEALESEDKNELSLSEATHLNDALNNLEDSPAGKEQKTMVVMKMVQDMVPVLRPDQVENVAQVLTEVGTSLTSTNITEVVKLMTDSTTSDVSKEDIKDMANMARKLSTPVTEEQVKAIADVKETSGSRMSVQDIMRATNEANQVSTEDEILKPTDVQIVVEMIQQIEAQDNPDKEELVAMMTSAAGQDLFTPDSSTRLTASTVQSLQAMGEREAEKIKDMVEAMEDNGSFNDAAEEAIIANEIMHMSREVDKESAETAVKVMENLDNLDADMVQKVMEMVKDVNIKPEDVEKIVEVTQNLDKDITPMEVKVVANLVSRMGPVITEREKQMMTRLAASSNVDLDLKEVDVLTEVTNEIGTDLNDAEVDLVVMLANSGEDKESKVVAMDDAAEIADVVQSMGAFMSSKEVDELKDVIREKAPALDEREVSVMTEVLVQVGPDVDANVVAKVAEAADKDLSPHAVDMLADMAKKIDAKITADKMEMVVDLVEKSGQTISPREMQMIQRMSQKANLTLSQADVKIVEDMVKMLGGKPTEKQVQLIAVLTEELGRKEENVNAEKLMDALVAMDGRPKGLGEMQALENLIETMEPLMTKSKAQVMSQVLVEADPHKMDMADLKELAEIVMQTSDDITPGDVEVVAQVARKGDEELTEKEVKVVAEMSSKFGDALSQREVQMIARMMRSSGLSMTLNDIVMVSDVTKVLGVDEISDNDAKLIAKMTEILSDNSNEGQVFTTTSKPFVRISMLPQKPTVVSLPEVTRRPSPPRIKMNMQLKNHRPPPSLYVPTEEPVTLPPQPANDGDFGLKDMRIRMRTTTTTTTTPAPEVPKSNPMMTFFNRDPLKDIKPTLDTLRTTTDAFNLELPEQSTQIKLEEFLMRNRPTPFRSFPSEDPPEDEAFQPAVVPTEVTKDDFVKMPGDSFMQISMGQGAFGEREQLRLPEAPVSRDTLKSVAENFAFTKNEPQGMLMNFLMNRQRVPTPPPMMTTTTTAMPMIWAEMMATKDPLTNLFNLESTTLDRTKSGNFIHMKMGNKDKPLSGVDPSVLPKLEKTRISLSPDNNSFMSMQMGNMISERMSTLSDSFENLVDTHNGQPIKRKLPGSATIGDPWQSLEQKKTPFTMRPTLPVGQATIWPRQTPGQTPFTVRPTIKPYVHLGGRTTVTPFTVRPTQRRPSLHQPKRRPHGYHQLQDGYMGIGAMSHPGIHDDRPPYVKSEGAKATFGDLEFNLGTEGLPDIPNVPAETKLLRDLPDIDQLNYEDDEETSASSSADQYQYGKSYLQNPYGADFIRLEIDANRYKHNKTRRIGGIHHIPLKIHGYAETSEYPVSTDTERPEAAKHLRPKKQIGQDTPFKAVRDAVENIGGLPDFMQSLVDASWMDKVWSSSSVKDEKKKN